MASPHTTDLSMAVQMDWSGAWQIGGSVSAAVVACVVAAWATPKQYPHLWEQNLAVTGLSQTPRVESQAWWSGNGHSSMGSAGRFVKPIKGVNVVVCCCC